MGTVNLPQDGDLETRKITEKIMELIDGSHHEFELTDALTSVVHTRSYLEVKNLATGDYFIVQIDRQP